MTREDVEFFERLFRSLEAEMNMRFAEASAEMSQGFVALNARLDQANARLERIGGLVNGGGRALTKMVEWSDKTDVSLADVLRRQGALEERLRKLEEKNQG